MTKSTAIGGKTLTITTGELARQAGGAVLVQYGDTVVLGTATMDKPFSPDADYLPLLVEYEEKFYAAGKIKGSRFIKREGRPTDDAIVTTRLIDRSIRPLFPKGMINDVQVVATVLSYDGVNDPDVPAIVATAAALMVSNIPWEGPLAAVRVGCVDDQYILNPTLVERERSLIDVVVSGSADRVVMIEASANEAAEEIILNGIATARQALGEIVTIMADLTAAAGKKKQLPTLVQRNEEFIQRVPQIAQPTLAAHLNGKQTKPDITQAEHDTITAVMASLTAAERLEITEQQVANAVHDLHGTYAREQVLQTDQRDDGRALDTVRPLSIRVGVLPRTHGSALFQRGETQILTVVTLGGPADVLLLDTMEIEAKKRYIHYYNFPGFSVGETKPNRGPGRREIGHGALAERALIPVLPPQDQWPYTMLLVSEVLESHGSSSMASVCGSSLALMDAGVPIRKHVAGIAMGLITDGQGNYKVLTDIAGIEDEKGDMDFKVAGTADGITALQMDIKIASVNSHILSDALKQARRARLTILEAMTAIIAKPRAELSPYAPRIVMMRVPVEKIGDLIGPRGKHINAIIEETGVDIDIEDDGLVSITSNDPKATAKAQEWVRNMTREVKPGERFEGKVTRLMDFGAFVELVPGIEGMVHISQFRNERVERISDVVKVGDVIPVVVVEIDTMGRINLSHKAAVNGMNASPLPRSGPGVMKGPRSGGKTKPGFFRGPRPPH